METDSCFLLIIHSLSYIILHLIFHHNKKLIIADLSHAIINITEVVAFTMAMRTKLTSCFYSSVPSLGFGGTNFVPDFLTES